MSGAKNFGVRSPPDPVPLRQPVPPPAAVQPPPPPPPAVAAAPPAADSVPCCCRCRCSCSPPAQVALVTVDVPLPRAAIPHQLLKPFPEPPPLRRPHITATATSVTAAGAPQARSGDPPSTGAPAQGSAVRPGPLQTAPDDSCPTRAPSDPDPRQRSLARHHQLRPAAAMFQGGEEEDHPYIRILDTPAPERPLLARYLQPLSWGGIGFGSAFVFNLFSKKPPFAGIQRHLALGAAGWVAGLYINKWIESNSAERDAVLKHYIQLHPEDFPVPERKKFGEILQPWAPLR